MFARPLRPALAAVASAAICAGVLAFAPGALAAKGEKALMVLTPAEVEATRLLPPPPSETSAQEKSELAELHRIIAARTPERLAQAKWDDDHEDPSLFYATIGGGFDLKTLPATTALLDVVMNDQKIAVSDAKKVFARKRPWAVDASIPTCDPNDKPTTSYPSGHAMVGYTVGTVLATLMPEKAQAIQARATDYAFSREVCGSHFASDTEASHVLGTAVAIELLSNPALQPKIAAAKAELRAAHFTGQ